jgi:hypothetical protein
MASRIFDRLRGTLGRERVDITGSFQPNGANTTVLNIKGNGFTVVHAAAANTYTVTLQDSYFDYDSAWCDAQSATLGVGAQITVEPDVKTAKTIVISVFDTGSKAASNDLAFNANTRIHFGIRLKNTSGNY